MERIFPKDRFLRFMKTEKKGAWFMLAWGGLSFLTGVLLWIFFPGSIRAGVGFVFCLSGAPGVIIGVRSFIWYLSRKVIAGQMPENMPKSFLRSEKERLDQLLPQLQRGREIALLFFILGLSLSLAAAIWEWSDYSLGLGMGVLIQSIAHLIYLLLRQWTNGLFRHEVERGLA